MNESIAVQKEKVKDKLKVDMKYSQLQKLETKIETNLNLIERHYSFLERMIIVLLVHNLLIVILRRTKCNHDHTTISKLENVSITAVEELTKQEEKV